MWNGSPRVAHFAEAAFRASTVAACVSMTLGPVKAQTSQRITVEGQVLPRCWASSSVPAEANRAAQAAARCSSRSTQVEIALDELGDGQPRPCEATTGRPDPAGCDRARPSGPLRITVRPRS